MSAPHDIHDTDDSRGRRNSVGVRAGLVIELDHVVAAAATLADGSAGAVARLPMLIECRLED